MGKVKIKNKGNPVFVGRILCHRGAVTEVNSSDLNDFCATPSGAFLMENSISVFDEDLKRKQAAELNRAKSMAEAKVRQELAPTIEKEIRAMLDREYAGRIDTLKSDIDSLESTVADLKKQLNVAKKAAAKETDQPKTFILDPEKHHIEHRGAGKWFVMNLEEKVYGPLTDQEKNDFEERLKAE